jgi:alkylation response protein AidB-like acyl-CoA dehydrogenase
MLIPRRDLDFQLYEVLDVAGLCRRPWFEQHDREVLDGTLDAAYRLAEERFLPYAALTDQQEPRLVDGTVHMVPETRAALDALGQGGFIAAAFDEAWGGLQLPYTLVQACSAVFAGGHVGFHAYAMLTAGAANLVLSFGTEEQKRRYARPMLEGRYFGTMCLSETGAGSSLADIRTRATPLPDGRYLVSGDKMWISGGEHELAENIVHMVLARLPDAPAGVRGISLFVVPRFQVGPDGSRGVANDVRLAGLNHKMGWRGTVNTVLTFGDEGRCTGELLGAPHRGLASMFQMMNEARIGVGICAVALGFAGYRYSLGYAQERRQGRPLSDKDPASPPVPIIAHADVRRMLLAQKSWVEGGLGLVLYCARLVDDIATGDDPAQRERDRMLLELLTPIAKSWPSEFCLEANKLAIQVLGGYGYTQDYPVERLYRDNRLNHIHEGAYGIHGLDLLGRKAALNGGEALRELGSRIGRTVERARAVASLAWMAESLAVALGESAATTRVLLEAAAAGRAEVALANATLYLEALGQVVVAWRWLEQAHSADAALATGREPDQAFYRGKLAACRYFFRYELPKTAPAWRLLRDLDETTTTTPVDQF